MNERILSGKIFFPAGTIPSLDVDVIIEVKYNNDENVDSSLAIYLNGVLTLGDDSDWDEGGEG